jgi:RNA polymerase sigma factor (sigma-70 family)
MNRVIEFVRRICHSEMVRDGKERSDGQLLENFVYCRDNAAFESLVRRHAPMVWGVCRRTLGNHHDAEDAFQATFLVLVRKAASIRSRELLANWLYGVAQKTASKARQMARKRSTREPQGEPMPEPQMEAQDQESGREQRELLDEELSRLPDKYRIAIVLCDLEERNRAEVAQLLCLKEGTVASRLARGRQMLAKRLIRRGITVSGASLAATLPLETASGAVPIAVLCNTIKSACLLASGDAAAAGAVSAQVSALTNEVLKAMAVAKHKAIIFALLVAALIPSGSLLAHHFLANPQFQDEMPPTLESTPPADNHEASGVSNNGLTPEEVMAKFGKEQDALKAGKLGLGGVAGPQINLTREQMDPLIRDVKATLNLETGHWTVKGVVSGYFFNNMRWIEWEADVSYTPNGRPWEWHTVQMDYAPTRGRLSAAACFTNAKSIIKPPIFRNLQDVPAIYLSGTTMDDHGNRIDSGTKVTDEDLKRIGGLKRLRILDLSDTGVTDVGLKHLENLPNLHTLNLHGCRQVTGTALK